MGLFFFFFLGFQIFDLAFKSKDYFTVLFPSGIFFFFPPEVDKTWTIRSLKNAEGS